MALRDDLLILAPEFSTETNEKLDKFLEWAGLSINRRVWPAAKADLGQINLAAHMLTIMKPGRADTAGAVTAERVGDLSVNYGQVNIKDAEELTTTSYGQTYVFLRRSIPATPLVV